MNILVTGATGFIGCHLVKRLSEQGHLVRCLVRKNSNLENLKELKVSLYEGDLLKKETLKGAVDKIDIIYHLAGEVYCRRSASFYEGNVVATKNLLEVCKGNNIKKFVYVSSIAVYKPPSDKIPLTENSPCYPITPYGRSKLEAERIAEHFYTNENVPITIVRAPVIYGPNEPKIVTDFFFKLIRNKKIAIIGNGENLRSLCYVDNFVDGLLLAGEKEKSIGKVYNISDKAVYSVNDILKTASNIIGEEIKVVYLPKIISNISWLFYNIINKLLGIYFIELYGIKALTLNLGCDSSLIQTELGYNPCVDLRNGLVKTFEWIKARRYG